MEIRILSPEEIWDEQIEGQVIKCPVCEHGWYSNEDYSGCEHLAFVLCTYDFPDFMLISEQYEDYDAIGELRAVIREYSNNL